MASEISVLIAVDSFKREFVGVAILANELRLRNIPVMIVSRHVLGYAYNYFRPNVVLIPKSHKIPELIHISKHSIVGLLQAESFTGNALAIKKYNAAETGGARPDLVDFIYCWGEFDYRVLTESGIYPSDKLVLSGNPATEIWYLPKAKELRSGKGTVIGITTSLRALTHASAPKNPIELIASLEKNGASGYFDPPYHAESWIAFEATWLRLILNLVERYPDHEFHIRPHPLESPQHYAYFEKYKNVRVGNKESIATWVDGIDVLCSFLSTSQIDAHVRGVHVISLKNLFPSYIRAGLPKALELDHDGFFDAPCSLDELDKLLTKPKCDNAAADRFAKEVFNFPSTIRPSAQIAEHIATSVKHLFDMKAPFEPIEERTPFKWLPRYARKDIIALGYREIRESIAGVAGVRLSYSPYRLFRNRRAKVLADMISSSC